MFGIAVCQILDASQQIRGLAFGFAAALAFDMDGERFHLGEIRVIAPEHLEHGFRFQGVHPRQFPQGLGFGFRLGDGASNRKRIDGQFGGDETGQILVARLLDFGQ